MHFEIYLFIQVETMFEYVIQNRDFVNLIIHSNLNKISSTLEEVVVPMVKGILDNLKLLLKLLIKISFWVAGCTGSAQGEDGS